MRFQVLGWALALAATAANAQNSTFCPSGGNGVCYAVNVAANAAKDLFFQITAPSSMSWVALGQGSSMSGSRIFVVYIDAAGSNVTVSPRLGTGHIEPTPDNTAMVTLLDGSKVSNGMMTANVKCSNCQSWTGGSMDLTSSSSNWIYAYKSGSAIKSDSVSATIQQHDQEGQFTFNLATATGGDGNVNPFTISSITTSSTGTILPQKTNSTTSPSSSVDMTSGNEEQIMDGTTAHGIMGAAAFILLFPSGSIVMRVFHFKYVLWVHVGLQITGYLVALAVMETGVWIAVNNDELMKTHPIIGLTVVCGLFFQPFLGLGHHVLYKRQLHTNSKPKPNIFTYPHIWYGRILITLGIINGILGLQLSGNTQGIEVSYYVVAGIVWAVWMGCALLVYLRSRDIVLGVEERDKPIIRRVDSYQ